MSLERGLTRNKDHLEHHFCCTRFLSILVCSHDCYVCTCKLSEMLPQLKPVPVAVPVPACTCDAQVCGVCSSNEWNFKSHLLGRKHNRRLAALGVGGSGKATIETVNGAC